MSATAASATAVSAARVRSWLRRAQRTERRSGWVTDIYFGVFLIGTLVAVAVGLFGSVSRLALDTTVRHDQAGDALFTIGLGWYAILLAGAGALGPVSIGQASLGWLATSAVGRRGLLWPAALGVYGLGLLAGALYGGLVLAAAPRAHPDAGLMLLVGALGGGIVAASAVLCQIALAGSRRVLLASGAVLVAAALALAVALGAGRPPGGRDGSAGLPTWLAWTGPWGWPLLYSDPGPVTTTAALVIGVAAAAALVAMLARLPRLPLVSLASGAESMQTAFTAVLLLDPGMAARAAEERAWARRQVRGGRLPRLPGRFAPLAHDLRLVARQPGRTGLAIASALLPFLVVNAVDRPVVAVAGWLVFGLLATGLTGTNLRRDRDFPELGRLLGISPLWMVVTRSVVPCCVALVWCTLSLQLLAASRPDGPGPGWLALGAAAAPALTVGAVRGARRGEVRHDVPMVDVVGTVLPPGPLRWASTGFDLAVPLLFPTLIAVGQGRVSWLLVAVQAAFSLVGGAAFLAAQRRR